MRSIIVNWTPRSIGAGWDVEPDAQIWVGVALVETSFIAGDQYVGPEGSGHGQAGRYENIGRHILSGHPLGMPAIALTEAGQIRFSDGRHRFAWVRDHGAAALPVMVDPAMAGRLSTLFGSSLRACEISVPEL
jgi:hypothetical protein